MSEYTEVIALPTGKLYENIPGEITIRAIGTQEEKIFYGSADERALDKVIQKCIVEPEGLDANDLTSVDKNFIMFRLRMLTYGDIYEFPYVCSECREKNYYEVDLTTLPVYYLDDTDFEEPYEFTLPVSQKVIGIKLLRGRDLLDIEQHSKRLNKKMASTMEGDISYILRMAQFIVTIDGEELPFPQKKMFVESMHGKDSAYFWHKLNSIEVGYDTTLYRTCGNPRCRIETEISLPMSAEFFRPKFRD